jgi:hypothetical protein
VALLVAALASALAGVAGHDLTQALRARQAVRAQLAADSTAWLAARAREQSVRDSIVAVVDARRLGDSLAARRYLVIALADNRISYREGERVLFESRVASGSGRTLEQTAGGRRWKFDTPRGRLVVERKDIDPLWVPPDWHYVEIARKKRLGITRLERGMSIPAGDGVVTVSGNNVVRRTPQGRDIPYDVGDGREIIIGGRIIIPPYGTNQRQYKGVLGNNRLYLGDGYGIHGTNNPGSIGTSVSHGCIRMRNEDIETLFRIVDVGTPVYIY